MSLPRNIPVRNHSPSVLKAVRDRNIYAPGEPVPPPGYKQPFFRDGGLGALLIMIGVFVLIVSLRLSGWYTAAAAFIDPASKRFADFVHAMLGF